MNTDRTLIVVPTYNERENVAALVAQLLEVAPDADVMLVDDDSPDGTAAFAEELFGANPRFFVLRRTGARGYGRSLVDGYRHALERGYARLVQLDADFSHDPRSIPALVAASLASDVVIGSRYCVGGRVENWPLRRRALSRFANDYVRFITGLSARDTTSGFRCYTRRALSRLLEGRERARHDERLPLLHAARAQPPARRPRRRRRLRLLGRGGLPRAARGPERDGSPDHLHRPARGAIEDVAQG